MGEDLCVGFIVFGDPVVKQRPRTVRSKGSDEVHTFTPQKTVDQENRIALVYKSRYAGFKFGKDVPLRLNADFFLKIPKGTSKKNIEKMLSGEIRPTKKNFDIDNGGKLVADALNKIAYEDDSQIVEMVFRKFYTDKVRTEIYISKV